MAHVDERLELAALRLDRLGARLETLAGGFVTVGLLSVSAQLYDVANMMDIEIEEIRKIRKELEIVTDEAPRTRPNGFTI